MKRLYLIAATLIATLIGYAFMEYVSNNEAFQNEVSNEVSK